MNTQLGYDLNDFEKTALVHRLSVKKTYQLKSPEGVIYTFDNVSKFSQEHGLNVSHISKVLSGKLKHSKRWTLPETILEPKKNYKQLGNSVYQLKSSEGVIYTFSNLTQFTKEHNLNKGNVRMVLNGKYGQTKGWTLPETTFETHREEVRIKHCKEFIVVSPSGEVVHGRHLQEFAKKYDLLAPALGQVISGKLRHHRGWTMYTGN